MKVGEYCRTDRGNIFQLKEIRILQEDGIWFKSVIKEDEAIKTTPSYDGLYYTESETIIKSSPNIIDLIEVGDFITYEKDNIYINIPTSVNGVFDETTLTIVKMVDNEYLKDVNIKSIITHEQMESIKYKLGE